MMLASKNRLHAGSAERSTRQLALPDPILAYRAEHLNRRHIFVVLWLFSSLVDRSALAQQAMASAFTYQGQLSDGGARANGTYDLQFTLFDAIGANLGTVTGQDVNVTDGLFVVKLDFGTNAFAGQQRFLEIGVRPGASGGAFTTLSPRQELTPAPSALFAGSASNADKLDGHDASEFADASHEHSGADIVSGTVAEAHIDSAIARDNEILATVVAGGGPDSMLNADLLDGLSSAAFAPANHSHDAVYWSRVGNSGTAAGSDFLGTTDNEPFELWVNNSRALRLEPQVTGPNVIGGHSNNVATFGGGATIAGGVNNRVDNDYAAIGGGLGNKALGGFSVVGGGQLNVAAFGGTTVCGGDSNRADRQYATVGGGQGNLASADLATVPGGSWAIASHYGQLAYASGRFGTGETRGDAQSSVFVLRAQSTGTGTVELFLDGNSQRMTVPTGSTWTFEALIVGNNIGIGVETGTSAGYRIAGVVTNDGGTTRFVGASPATTTLGADAAATTWVVTAGIHAASNALVINAKGNGNSINHFRWVATVRTVELGSP